MTVTRLGAAVGRHGGTAFSADELRWHGAEPRVHACAPFASLAGSGDAWHGRSPSGTVAVADARLDDVDALTRRLRPLAPWLPERPSPGDLVAAAVDEWGAACADALHGDFALVAWDGRRRSFVAARDPFGGTSLFYGVVGGCVVVASEVKQLLGSSLVAPVPDDLTALEFLTDTMSSAGRTFFGGVSRLLPGWVLEVGDAGYRTRRWWRPDLDVEDTGRPAALFAEAFERAVGRRVDSAPAATHVSGGLDSSSVAIVAGARNGHRPPLVGIAHRYPGYAADNGRLIAEVAERLPFPVRAVDLTSVDPLSGLDDVLFAIDSPLAWPERIPALEAPVMGEAGARLLLTGFGADEVLFEDRHLGDLARSGRLLSLARQTRRVHRFSPTPVSWWLQDSARSAVPRWARAALRSVLPSRPRTLPAWVEPSAPGVSTWLEGVARPPGSRGTLTQRAIIDYLGSPRLVWALETYTREARGRGYGITHPFLDRDLVERVLKIPFERRLPVDGWKRLLRASMADRLPAGVLTGPKVGLDDFEAAVRRRAAAVLLDRVDPVSWPLQSVVTVEAARGLAAACLAGDGDAGRVVWRLLCLARCRDLLDRYW